MNTKTMKIVAICLLVVLALRVITYKSEDEQIDDFLKNVEIGMKLEDFDKDKTILMLAKSGDRIVYLFPTYKWYGSKGSKACVFYFDTYNELYVFFRKDFNNKEFEVK